MKKFSLDEWRAYLLAQAKEYRVEIKEKRPAVTISRETGAGAITIGKMVTDSFQSLEKGAPHSWALFDQNIVKAVLEDQGLPKHLEEFIKEEGKPALEGRIRRTPWSSSFHSGLGAKHEPNDSQVGHSGRRGLDRTRRKRHLRQSRACFPRSFSGATGVARPAHRGLFRAK